MLYRKKLPPISTPDNQFPYLEAVQMFVFLSVFQIKTPTSSHAFPSLFLLNKWKYTRHIFQHFEFFIEKHNLDQFSLIQKLL